MHLTKEQSRKRWAELRDLVVGWDPLGLIHIGSPRDEYDCLLGPLMRYLEQRAPDGIISSYLQHEFSGHFGVSAYPSEAERTRFAQTVRAWFAEHWSDTSV
jgi:hypothetical protein